MIKLIIFLFIYVNYQCDGSSIAKRNLVPKLCLNSPCQNNGTCIQPDPNLYIAYCNCSLQFTGIFCEIKKNFCELNECKNGGICNQKEEKCDCPSMYFYGKKCEKEVKSCDLDPCKNKSKCLSFDGKTTCLCIGNFEGEFCDKPKEENSKEE